MSTPTYRAPAVRELRAAWSARRHAVPRWMIEQATACRVAGDWRGACTAAQFDAEFETGWLAGWRGNGLAAQVEADLAHLAPDLLRWHLSADLPRMQTPLKVYRTGAALTVALRDPGTPSRRLVLRFVDRLDAGSPAPVAPQRWDVRSSHGLLRTCSTLHGRVPFFTADGDRLAEQSWGTAERIIALQDAGDWAAAWQLAGFDVTALLREPTSGGWRPAGIRSAMADGRHDLAGLPGAVRGAGAREVTVRLGSSPYTDVLVDAATLTVREGDGTASSSVPALHRPVDFELVRHGIAPVDQLHPLVGDALFPALEGLFEGPDGPRPELSPVRVRCAGVWHFTDHPHSPEELRRELTLRALGGASLTGCFAAHAGWRDPSVRLPKALRERRRAVQLHAVNGDGPGLLAWLDAGLDPHLRDEQGRTLLHLIAWLPEPEPVLTRLRHAGLDPQARDQSGLTPLEHAETRGGTPAAVRALERFSV